MSPRQKWVLASLALWVLPALVFWVGFWQWEASRREAIHARSIADMTAFLDRARAEGDPLWQRSVGWSRAFTRWVRTGRPPVPAGGLGRRGWVILFDGAGQVRSPDLAPDQKAAVERLFAWIRQPAWAFQPLPPDGFAEAASAFPDPVGNAVKLRARGSGRLWATPATIHTPVAFPVAGFWWNPVRSQERAGMLVLLRALPERPAAAWERVVAGALRRGRQLGFVLPGGDFRAPPGVASAAWRTTVERYRREPGQVFPVSAGNLVFREAPAGVLLAGVLPPLPEPGWLKAGLATVLLVVTGLVLTRVHAFFVRGIPFQLSLGAKLLGLLGLGVGFPLAMAGTVGEVFLRGKEAALIEDIHREARSFLETVDTGFAGFAAHRGLVYSRRLGETRQPPPSLEQAIALARSLLERFVVLEAFLIGASSQVLLADSEPWLRLYRPLVLAPLHRRRALLKEWLAMGWVPLPQEWDLFGPDPQNFRRGPSRTTFNYFKRLVKALQSAGPDLISYANSLRGVVAQPAGPRSELPIEGFLGEEFSRLLRGMRAYLFHCRTMEAPMGSVMLYATVLTDAHGLGQAALVFTHHLGHFQADYLRSVFRRYPATGPAGATGRRPSRRPPGSGAPAPPPLPGLKATEDHRPRHAPYPSLPLGAGPWKALSLHNYALSSFPPGDDPAVTMPLREEMRATGATVRTFERRLGSQDFLVTLYRGTQLRDYLLVRLTPREEVTARLAGFRQRIWGILAGTTLVGLVLTGLFLGRLLMPLEAIAQGIRALRRGQATHPLPAHGGDELGLLCGEYNRTLDLLREMEVAAVVQRQLLPPGPVTCGALTAMGINRMTQAVGGDYYDFQILPNGHLAVIMGDVSGHGVSAALVTAMAKAAFALLCPRHPDDPAAVFDEMHRALLDLLGKRKMMTCWLGYFDPAGTTLRYVNAGQTFPLTVDERTGEIQEVVCPSRPLGITRSTTYKTLTLPLDGRAILLYSDCLVEAQDANDQEVGFDRLGQAVQTAWRRNPQAPLPVLLELIEEITRPVPWTDDATVVLVRTRAP